MPKVVILSTSQKLGSLYIKAKLESNKSIFFEISELHKLLNEARKKNLAIRLDIDLFYGFRFLGTGLLIKRGIYGFQGTIMKDSKIIGELKRDRVEIFFFELFDSVTDYVDLILKINETIRVVRMITEWLRGLEIRGESGTLDLGMEIIFSNHDFKLPNDWEKMFERHKERYPAIPSITLREPKLW